MIKRTFPVILAVLAACSTAPQAPPPSSFLIFFQQNSAALIPDARPALDAAAAAIMTTHPKSIVVAVGAVKGTTRALAEARYAAVQKALVASGVAETAIAHADFPVENIKAGEVGNQRVEIILGSGR